MTGLLDCPNELLLNLFMLSDNIDDALHMARCAKQLHAVFESYRLSILKSIVVSSSHGALVLILHRRLIEAAFFQHPRL
jgi:hypothetical protein